MLAIISCPIYGQELAKQQLTEADYEKWGKLENNTISEKGNWVSYTMYYDNGQDTLFISNTKNGKQYSYPKATQG
ncbi:MAG: hypothetical protein K2P85_09630, partial [Flavobacteriaceae bacterium]|nr:hypothetical protein [Flavobacteriaceae bacterium]